MGSLGEGSSVVQDIPVYFLLVFLSTFIGLHFIYLVFYACFVDQGFTLNCKLVGFFSPFECHSLLCSFTFIRVFFPFSLKWEALLNFVCVFLVSCKHPHKDMKMHHSPHSTARYFISKIKIFFCVFYGDTKLLIKVASVWHKDLMYWQFTIHPDNVYPLFSVHRTKCHTPLYS